MDELNGRDMGDIGLAGDALTAPAQQKTARRPGRAPRRQSLHHPSPVQRLLRPAEVAEILQVHQSNVYRMARRGVLTSVVLPPKTLRFRQSDIESFIRECATKPKRQVIA